MAGGIGGGGGGGGVIITNPLLSLRPPFLCPLDCSRNNGDNLNSQSAEGFFFPLNVFIYFFLFGSTRTQAVQRSELIIVSRGKDGFGRWWHGASAEANPHLLCMR